MSVLAGGKVAASILCGAVIFFLLDSCEKFCSGHIILVNKFVFYQVKAVSALLSKLQYFFIRYY